MQSVETIPERTKPAEKDKRGTVLAEGEATGHHHTLPPKARLFRYDDTALTSYVDIGNMPLALKHQEHGPIKIKGKNEVRIQRQWTLGRMKRVVD